MAKINNSSFRDWNDGDTIKEYDYEQEREILQTAINDNYDRLFKNYKVVDVSGAIKTTQTLDTAINYLNFKESSTIVLTLDNTASTLQIAVIDGSITTNKLADLGVTTSKIADGNVTTLKLADLSVTRGKIADQAINLQKLDLVDLDSRYYTETEIDQTVANLEGVGRTTETIKGNADNLSTHKTSGDHDGRYYTESEMDSFLSDIKGTGRTTETLVSNKDDLEAHKAKTDNPHNVTASQVGAYSKTEVQTSGSAQIHWENLTNVPAFADSSWKAPVATKLDLPTTDNQDGDLRIVLDEDSVYTYDGATTSWKVIGASGSGITDHGTLKGLTDDDHLQYLRTDGTRLLTGDLDFGHFQALNMRDHSGTSFPSDAQAGQRFFRTDQGKSYQYNGSSWQQIMGIGAVPRRDSFTASLTGTETFTITNGQYEPNTFSLLVFKNGTLTPHTEVSNTQFSLDVTTSDKVTYWLLENSPEVVGNYKMGKFTRHETLSSDTTTIPINISEFVEGNDLLMFFVGGTMKTEGVEYSITNGDTLNNLQDTWLTGTDIDIVVIKNVRVLTAEDYIDASMIQDGTLTKPKLSTTLQKEIEAGYNDNNLYMTYVDGELDQVTESDANGTIKTTDLSYNVDGDLKTVVEVINGKTVTSTLNYDVNGNLTSVTKVVS